MGGEEFLAIGGWRLAVGEGKPKGVNHRGHPSACSGQAPDSHANSPRTRRKSTARPWGTQAGGSDPQKDTEEQGGKSSGKAAPRSLGCALPSSLACARERSGSARDDNS